MMVQTFELAQSQVGPSCERRTTQAGNMRRTILARVVWFSASAGPGSVPPGRGPFRRTAVRSAGPGSVPPRRFRFVDQSPEGPTKTSSAEQWTEAPRRAETYGRRWAMAGAACVLPSA